VFQTDDALRHSDNNLAMYMFIYFNHLNAQMAEWLFYFDCSGSASGSAMCEEEQANPVIMTVRI
jgi:hypothetical protein